ncbi:hypothetical protein EPIRMAN_GEN20615_04970 [Ralstonia mannitolilytica]|nr:hypothetical protein R76706_01041 [Ralstonia mannitolilytica]CAJ0797618.1 hypothetical protein R77555_03094 [Ralstonia mannitolilytica]
MASAAIARRCLGTKEHKRHTPWGVRCENQGRTHQALPDRRGHCGVRATDGDGGVGAGQRHGERRNQRGRFLEQRGIGVDDTWWVRIIGLAGRWFGWLIFRGLGSTQSLHEPVAHSACRTSSAANRTEQNRTEDVRGSCQRAGTKRPAGCRDRQPAGSACGEHRSCCTFRREPVPGGMVDQPTAPSGHLLRFAAMSGRATTSGHAGASPENW